MSLNGLWKFAFDNERRYRRPSDITDWPLTIQVPFPPESTASGIGDTGYHFACWYEREFQWIPDQRHVLLHFGAVDYFARVWVNGHLVATHEGGHTPFHADITFALSATGVQTVTVMAYDDPLDLTKPRGKQDWQVNPHSIWYPRTSGIWQTVWLEPVAATYIDKIQWTPHLDGYALGFEARVGGAPIEYLIVDLLLLHRQRVLAQDSYVVIDGEADRRIILSDPGIDDSRNELLWSPERPTLLNAHIRLRQGEVVLDEFTSYTALRSVEAVRDRFMLNGRPYPLRLVLDQGYWPDTLLAAPSDDALRKDVELAKQMGFNGVRKHQKIEDPRYLYWADRLGLLVWEEMPSAYRFTRTAIQRTIREWSEAIERDFSHPCIIAWVPFNESWGVPELPNVEAHRHGVHALYHLTKTFDPTRPVIANDGWESGETDIVGIHDYSTDPEHMRERYGHQTSSQELFAKGRPGGRVLTLDGFPHRGQPIMLTEFGGVAYAPGGEDRAENWGYFVSATADEFLERYTALLDAVTHSPLLSGFCYTQFADTFQEVNGLLHADRTPKIPIERIRAATLGGKRRLPERDL
jgi:beta-galactosidase/beta-glucuronidase